MRKDINGQYFRELLDKEKNTVIHHLEQETNLLSAYPETNPDILDAAVKTITQNSTIEMISYLKSRQNQIEEALKRLDSESFGLCMRCGRNIDMERLEAKPYARYCVKCKRKME